MTLTLPEFEDVMSSISPPVAVATSGGADSLALLLLTHKWAENKGGRVVALTVDHGLRSESTQEAQKVHQWVSDRGIDHVILTWEGNKPTTHISEEARNARYHLLTNWCKTNHILTLLLGHHAQDQAETFWMRLASGSGLDGLCAMKKETLRAGIRLLRPLLSIEKERLKEILIAENQEWIEDPSNENPVFFRGRLRNFLNEEGLSSQRLLNTVAKLQEDTDFIQECLQKAIEDIVHQHPGGYLTLHKELFEELHPTLAKRLVCVCMGWFSDNPYPPRSHQIEGILEKLKLGLPFTAGGIYWFNQKGQTYLSREISVAPPPLFLSDIHGKTLWDHRLWIDPEIKGYLPQETYLQCSSGAVRQYSRIDTVPPQHCNADILGPRRVRNTLPALLVKGKVVAIPHLCYNFLDSGRDLKKFFNLKPLFHDSLTFTI